MIKFILLSEVSHFMENSAFAKQNAMDNKKIQINTNPNSFLETEKIGTLMRRFALPCIISLLVGALYNIVDQIFIANADYLGSFGNAANTVVYPFTVIALAVATMIGDGCCAFVSLSLGANNSENARRSIGNSVALACAVGLVITAVYLLFAEPMLIAFGANVNTETFAMSKEYFFWITLGIPFYMFGQAMSSIIRSDGSPGYAMAVLLSGAICNIILDPIFIFGFHMGMTGAAVATVLGQILSAILSFIYLFKMKAVKLKKKAFKPKARILGKVISLGIPSFLAQISIVLSIAAVLNVCQTYGAKDPIFGQAQYAQIPTAVIGIVMKFFQIVISVAIGLSAGCIPIVGYNIGACRNDRAKELLKKLLLCEAIIGLVAMIIFESLPLPLINLFGAKNESIHYTDFAVRCIRLFLCTIVISCINKGTFIYLQAMGRPLASTLLSLMREVVFGVGLVILLPIWFKLDGLLYFMALSDVLTFIATIFVLIFTFKRLNK